MQPGLKYLLAIICCLILGNLYYAQPIITDIAPDVGLDTSAGGIIVTMAQIGYCLGVLFLVPLGDAIENRRLISTLVCCSGIALVAAALSGSMVTFLTAMFFIGLFSCSVQIIIPLSVGLVSEEERGKVVGLIISGALLGIVLSRPLSSWVTGVSGWRTMFFIAAVMMVVVALCIYKLPKTQPVATGIRYSEMLKSMANILLYQPGLKKRLATMVLVFMSFTMFWAAAPIAMQDMLNFSHSDVALFSLISLAAPPCALFAGQMIDRGKGFHLTVVSITMLVIAFLITPLFGVYMMTFVIAVLFLDPGVHMTNVVTQQGVLALVPQARSRINALCIAFTFIGGATGSTLGPWLYSHFGWFVTALVGAMMVLCALIVNLSLRVNAISEPVEIAQGS